MSFDSTFDYSAVKTYLTDQITSLQLQITNTDNCKSVLEASTYAGVLTNKIATLTATCTSLYAQVAQFQEVLDEISALEILGSGDKATLYAFYGFIPSITKPDFMARMLFNYSSMIANSDLAAIIADVSSDPEAIGAVAETVYNAYQLNSEHVQSLVSIYRLVTNN